MSAVGHNIAYAISDFLLEVLRGRYSWLKKIRNLFRIIWELLQDQNVKKIRLKKLCNSYSGGE